MKKKNPYLLIYNPHAGKKRKMVSGSGIVSLEQVKGFLKQYQIPADYAPTQRPGHATELAHESIKKGYDTVLVAGGDGTTGEAANGLVGSDVKLGIIPMGSFMNIAKMLSIPPDIEKAIELIKIGRIRKIDVGTITHLEGDKLADPYYFIETAGIGLEALVQQEFKKFEKGEFRSLLRIVKMFITFYANKVTIKADNEEIITRATLISIANGPFTGANLQMSPKARLNDHLLTITLYKMSKKELISYFLNLKFKGKTDGRRLTTIQTKTVKISSKKELLMHADATLFGKTPVECKIFPNALNVICGFPATQDGASLNSRTLLDP